MTTTMPVTMLAARPPGRERWGANVRDLGPVESLEEYPGARGNPELVQSTRYFAINKKGSPYKIRHHGNLWSKASDHVEITESRHQ